MEKQCKYILETVDCLLTQYAQLFTESQLYTLNRISVYAIELIVKLSFEHKIDDEKWHRELIEAVTPILGYAQMLSEGWVGELPVGASNSAEYIMQQATVMRDYLIAPNLENLSELMLAGETSALVS